jgi:MSHA biogenesis protein MshM
MYLEYFTLKRHPFRITPDPTLFFPGGGRGEILEALIYAITTGEGIVKVVGEVGSGKTMLCRLLEERLPKSIEIVYLANPSLSPHDILYAIAFELKLPVTVETERLMVMQQLQTYLLRQHSANRSVVVFIEEAQGMPVETLEEIRLLSNLETHQHKLLQIVLFGQPELEKNLRKRSIRQLKERITHSFHLEPLTTVEVGEYIRFRLQAAGCGKSGVFASGAERLIARASRGLIRRINILADKALLASYADPDTGMKAGITPMVRSRHVQAAIRDSEFNLPVFSRPVWLCAGVLLVVLVSAAVAGWHRSERGTVLPAFLNSKSLQGRQGESRLESDQTKNNVPSAEMPAAIRPDPEKQVGIEPEKSLLTAAGPASVSEAERPVAPLTSESEPAPSRTAQALSNSPAQNKGVEKSTSATSQRIMVKPDKSLMESRRKATIQWLQKADREAYTIQLMAVDSGNDADMEKFFRHISPVSLLDRIYIFPIQRGGHTVWIVAYNEFRESSSARQALDALPGELRRFQPFVRRLGELLRDFEQTNAHN